MLRTYAVLVSVSVWLLLVPWHLVLICCRRATWQELRERMGSCVVPAKMTRRRILIHGVSVGEMAVVEPIMRALLCKENELEIFLTTGNRDGRARAERMQASYPQIKETLMLPWDRAGAMLGWLQNLAPDLVAVVETEIWPSFFASCKQLGVPLCIVNGRVYQRDAGRYRMARRFFSRVLSCVTWIGVQSLAERARFVSMGAAPAICEVVGNAKFDAVSQVPEVPDVRLQGLEGAPSLLVGGSTHAPEERWLLEAFLDLRKAESGLRLILAPRHVNRCTSIARLAQNYELQVAQWSSFQQRADPWEVLLIDELGWLSTIYAFADVVVIGGSFIPKGGHNPLEAAVHERAIVVGPHTENFQDIVEDFCRNGGLLRLRGEGELISHLGRLLQDADERREIGARAHSLLLSRQGVATRYADALAHRLKPAATSN